MGYVQTGKQIDRRLTESRIKQKYCRTPGSQREKGNRRQNRKGCVSQVKRKKKRSGSFPGSGRPSCLPDIGFMRFLYTLILHMSKPELELSFLMTKGSLFWHCALLIKCLLYSSIIQHRIE